MNMYFEISRALVAILLCITSVLIFTVPEVTDGMKRIYRRGKNEISKSNEKNIRERFERDIEHKDKRGFAEKLMDYTGLRRRFKYLSGRSFAAANICYLAGVSAAVSFLFDYKMGAIVVSLLILCELIILAVLRRREEASVNDNFLRLLDFLSNFSLTGENISEIFRQVSLYVENPLADVMGDFAARSFYSGDTEGELMFMAEKIENERFKEFIANIAVGLKYSADLKSIISLERKSVSDYLKSSRSKKSLMVEGLVNLFILCGMSLASIMISASLTGMSVMKLLTSNPVSICSSVVLVAVIMIYMVGVIRGK